MAGYNRSDERTVRQWAGPMGVYDESDDDAGGGVFGYDSSTESTAGGVTGRAESPDAAGVPGENGGGGPGLRANGFVERESTAERGRGPPGADSGRPFPVESSPESSSAIPAATLSTSSTSSRTRSGPNTTGITTSTSGSAGGS